MHKCLRLDLHCASLLMIYYSNTLLCEWRLLVRYRRSPPNPGRHLAAAAWQPGDAEIIGRFVKNSACDAACEC
jgi:hypothetical protein